MRHALWLAGLAALSPGRAAAEVEKIKIAVMDLRLTNVPDGMGETLTTIVSEELDQLGAFKTISMRDIAQMMALERLRDLMACDQESCIREIGGALGADLLLSGTVTRLDNVYLIQLNLTNIARATVENRVSREYAGDAIGLTRDLRAATRILVRDILASRSGDLALTTLEEGATVRVNDSIVGVTPLEAPLRLAEGLHTLVVEKEGFVRFSKDVQVGRDEVTRLEISLRPSQEFLALYESSARSWRVAGWSLLACGAAALLGGALAAVSANDGASEYRREYERDPSSSKLGGMYDTVVTLDAVTLATGIVALLGLASGAAVLLMGPDPERYEQTFPVTGVAGTGATLGLRF